MITTKQHTAAIAAAYAQGFEDGKLVRRRGQQADSFRSRYNDDSRKGEKFRTAESLRKRKWQKSEAGQESNRERQRRWKNKQSKLHSGDKITVETATTAAAPVQKPTKPVRKVTTLASRTKLIDKISGAASTTTVRAKAAGAKVPVKAVSRKKVLSKQK